MRICDMCINKKLMQGMHNIFTRNGSTIAWSLVRLDAKNRNIRTFNLP